MSAQLADPQSMFLTVDEVRELTGRQRRQAQGETLRALGIEHRVRPDGSVLVLRAHVEHQLGGGTPSTRKRREYEIDRSAL